MNHPVASRNINVNLNTLILDIRSVERASRQTQINGNSNYDIELSVGARRIRRRLGARGLDPNRFSEIVVRRIVYSVFSV